MEMNEPYILQHKLNSNKILGKSCQTLRKYLLCNDTYKVQMQIKLIYDFRSWTSDHF